jgi:hypothetical protein
MACNDIRGTAKVLRAGTTCLVFGAAIAVGFAIASIAPHQAQASPAFTAQTKQPCTACHTSPPSAQNLTDVGKKFKENGNQMPKPK